MKKIKLYCHYFNNKKTCPYEEECVFLHEDAKNCKYGMECERLLCMFKHEFNPESITIMTEEIVEDILTVDEPSETIDHDNVNFNSTFTNPSQVDKISNEEKFKCEKCDFAFARKSDINNHKMTNHNWCSKCYSSFDTQENLQNHIQSMHKKKKKTADRNHNVGEAP